MTASSEKREPCVLGTVWSAHDGRRDTGYGTNRCGRPLAAVPADARGMRLLFRLEDSMKYGYRRESRIRGCRIRHQLDPTSRVSHIGANRLRIDGFCLRKGRGAWFHPVIDADSMICVSNNRRTRRGRPVGIGPRQRHPKVRISDSATRQDPREHVLATSATALRGRVLGA